MLQTNNQGIQTQNPVLLREAYNKYGSMLYGYLLSVLNDEAKAEKVLTAILTICQKPWSKPANVALTPGAGYTEWQKLSYCL